MELLLIILLSWLFVYALTRKPSSRIQTCDDLSMEYERVFLPEDTIDNRDYVMYDVRRNKKTGVYEAVVKNIRNPLYNKRVEAQDRLGLMGVIMDAAVELDKKKKKEDKLLYPGKRK